VATRLGPRGAASIVRAAKTGTESKGTSAGEQTRSQQQCEGAPDVLTRKTFMPNPGLIVSFLTSVKAAASPLYAATPAQ